MISTNNGTRHQLTREEILDLVDREARRRMGMSGEQFMAALRDRKLPETVAKRDIEMIVRLLGGEWRTAA